jgi:hypothetical protein
MRIIHITDYSSYGPTLPHALDVPYAYGWKRWLFINGYLGRNSCSMLGLMKQIPMLFVYILINGFKIN